MTVHREWVEAGFIYGDSLRDVSDPPPHPTGAASEGLRPRATLMQRLIALVVEEEARRQR